MRPSVRPVVRSAVTPPASEPLNLRVADVNLGLSPDGSRLVYRASLNGQPHLFVRALGELQATPLLGLGSNPRNPFVSADGNWVGFFDSGENLGLRKVSIHGGPASTITPVSGPRGASWAADDTIIFATTQVASGLWRVPAGGGAPEQLTTPNATEGEQDHLFPEILPGGEVVLFTITRTDPTENAQVALLSLITRQYEVLFSGGSNPRYLPTGHIVYGVTDVLWARSFDLDRLEVTGDPVPVVDGVVTSGSGAANFAVAQDGSLVYVTGSGGASALRTTLVWVDREGGEEVIDAEPDNYFSVRLSPDGSRVALAVADEAEIDDVYIYDLSRNDSTQITFNAAWDDHSPLWTPDGNGVVFSSAQSGALNLFWTLDDGTGPVTRLTESINDQVACCWSADGQSLIFVESGVKGGAKLDHDGGGTLDHLAAGRSV